MLHNAEFFGTFDITSLVLTVFVLFFFGLMLYLRREDRREGYPLESDENGQLETSAGMLFAAAPKIFRMSNGEPLIFKPDTQRDGVTPHAARRSNVSGTPIQPVGSPMLAGIGPGAYANRQHIPDRTDHGALKIAPLRNAPTFFVDRRDPDPRGMTVLGADRKPAGVVSDVWIDQGEIMIRYLEVELSTPSVAATAGLSVVGHGAMGRKVLLPMTMAVVSRGRVGTVKVDAILAHQFADVPAQESPDQVTRYEEERIMAYYGAGYLYATPARLEPLL